MRLIEVSHVTLEVNKQDGSRAEALLAGLGLGFYRSGAGRNMVGKEPRGFRAMLNTHEFDEDPSAIFNFPIAQSQADAVAQHLYNQLGLQQPGRGTLYLEPARIGLPENTSESEFRARHVPGVDIAATFIPDLVKITAIVQRGEGGAIAEDILGRGLAVPSITFGIGTGLRDRLGLIRITFPADKDIVKVVVSSSEAREIFDALVDTGKLDQPGKGFIYMQPVDKGHLNTLIFRGRQRHAASMEQVIQALDTIQGNSTWRQRLQSASAATRRSRRYLENSVSIIITCTDGMAKDFVMAAMAAGAAGATVGKTRQVGFTTSDPSIHALEESHVIVPESTLESILLAVETAGLFGDQCHGGILVKKVPSACTYLGK